MRNSAAPASREGLEGLTRSRMQDHEAHKAVACTTPRQCLCAPTTHEGSFRCRLHRNVQNRWPKPTSGASSAATEEVNVSSLTPQMGSDAALLTQPPSKCSSLPPRPSHSISRPPLFRPGSGETVEAR
ncbi:hypothetical protein KP509_29G029500 [Ceratopteris richardii]|nr:hypothetical protein KP509_29G029500 [Ceratopteris richardii]